MDKIKIISLFDESDCETCGPSWAEGYQVYLNDKEIILLEPVAHCYSGSTHSETDLIKEILNHLNYEVEFSDE